MNVEVLPRRDVGGPSRDDPHPVVARPNPGLPGLAIAVIAAICAVLLFVVLDAQRRNGGSDAAGFGRTETSAFAPPPPLVVPPEPVPPVIAIPVQPEPAPVTPPRTAAPVPIPAPRPVVMAPAPPAEAPSSPVQTDPSLAAPALIYDFGAVPEGPGKAQPAAPPGPAPAAGAASSPAASRVQQPPARTTRIANPTTVVPSGTLIKAVLETPIDTSRPGLARAIVSRDTRGFDGKRVLVPRGSRLIGEYESDIRTGQSKVLVNWTQLVRPDGSVIRLDSPAADALGGAGVPGRVNTFFFQRFANALLQTALTVGGSLAVWNSDAPVVVGLPQTATTAVTGQGNSLVGQAPQPRIKVKQGTQFNVFVARDLDFSGAPILPELVRGGGPPKAVEGPFLPLGSRGGGPPKAVEGPRAD